MRIPHLAIFALAATAIPALAGLAIQNGTLLLRGGSIQTDTLSVHGTLAGNGVLATSSAHVGGILAPEGEYPEETGTLRFDGEIEFAGTYECTVNGNADVDLVQATDSIYGAASIAVSASPSAIPLEQTILSGAENSNFSAFSIDPGQASAFRLSSPAPGSLALTDLVGDSDSDGLPDYWEFAHYTNRLAAIPSGDDDDDRSDNRSEFAAGTDPRDDRSVFAIVHSGTDGGHTIVWNSVSGKTYAVQAAASITGAFDQALASGLPATPPLNSWTNPLPATFGPFYRIVLDP